MQRNILIIEDNQVQLDRLSDIVLSVNSDIRVFAVKTTEKAYQIAMENTIDCFLVDIILDTSRPGDTSGIKFVSRIRNISKYYTTPVFIITSLTDPTNYAYTNLHCLDYIEKPFDEHRIVENVRKVLQIPVARENDRYITFRKDGILYPIMCNEIVYIECKNHSIFIHMENGKTFETQYRTCQDIIEEADSSMLIQCNRSIIVNIKYIQSVDLTNRYIAMREDGIRLPIGITYKKKIARIFEK